MFNYQAVTVTITYILENILYIVYISMNQTPTLTQTRYKMNSLTALAHTALQPYISLKAILYHIRT